jgi:hypothetical protein
LVAVCRIALFAKKQKWMGRLIKEIKVFSYCLICMLSEIWS